MSRDGKRGTPDHGLVVRKIVTDWYYQILVHKRPLDELLQLAETAGEWRELAARDKAFARSMIMETLRHKGQIDQVLGRLLEKRPPSQSRVWHILSVAVAQLLFLEVAPHAAIHLAVDQAKSSNKSRHLAKLVNAVLRRIVREELHLQNDTDGILSSIPSVIFDRWQSNYGADVAKNIALASLRPAALDLGVKGEALQLAEQLGGLSLAPFPTIRLEHRGPVNQLPGYHDGQWWVQDFAAQLPVLLMGPLKGKRVLDLCAAPGGKTAQLITRGANVTALDLSRKRLDRLEDNLKRLQLKAELVSADLFDFQPKEAFDCVLLDAPCSATGTLRRHPDILCLKSVEQIMALAVLQARMARHALGFLKDGGMMIYCTCSLEPEEGEAQIEALLRREADVKRWAVGLDEVNNQDQWITDQGDVRLLPQYNPPGVTGTNFMAGMDGFFISRLIKG